MSSEEKPSNININPNLGDLIPLCEASRISGLSAGHLRLLVSTGQLWGKKISRNWLTTNQAIDQYVKVDHKTGPKPKESS